MESGVPEDITGALRAWSNGAPEALQNLISAVEPELRRIASRCLERESPDPILQTTALVNEIYLRLIDVKRARWQDRAHFFAVCAQIMRRILVDYARARRTGRRGGGRQPISFDEAVVIPPQPTADLVAIDEALQALGELDPRKMRVVELRFFGGLSVKETAEVLKVSIDTVHRDWRLAKVWLHRELSRE